MAHGGARDGAGRKAEPPAPKKVGRKTNEERRQILKEVNNQTFDEKATEALPELFDTIKTIAQGYRVAVYNQPRKVKSDRKFDADGEPIWVYFVPPDKDAVKYLIDRAAGKAAVKNPEATETELILEFAMDGEDDDVDANVE